MWQCAMGSVVTLCGELLLHVEWNLVPDTQEFEKLPTIAYVV